MKKLQLLALCSLFAVGSEMSLQAWGWGGEPAKAKTSENAPTNSQLGEVKEPTAAEKQAEKDRITAQDKEATDRINSQADRSSQQVNDVSNQAKSLFGKNRNRSASAPTNTNDLKMTDDSRARSASDSTGSKSEQAKNLTAKFEARKNVKSGTSTNANSGTSISEALNSRGEKISKVADQSGVISSNAQAQATDAATLRNNLQNSFWNWGSKAPKSAAE